MITLGLVDSVDDNGVYVTMPGSRGLLRGPYRALSTVAAGTTVLVASTDDGEQVVVGPAPAGEGTVSVVSFGAVGDGVTDDTAAIQLALDAGSDVVVPSGRWRTTATLTVPTRTKLSLRAGAVIAPDGVDFHAFSLAAESTLQGGRITSPEEWDGANTSWVYAVVNVAGNNVTVRDVVIENVPKTGVGVREYDNVTITDCRIEGNYPADDYEFGVTTGHFGIMLDPAASTANGNLLVANNLITGCISGVYVGNFGSGAPGHGVTVTGNIFHGCHDHAVYIGQGEGYTVSGNTVNRCRGGIVVTGSGHTVVGNAVTSGGTGDNLDIAHISLRDAIGCVATGNTVRGDAASGQVMFDVVALAGTEVRDNVISGNIVIQTNSDTVDCIGMRVGGSTADVLTNNVVRGNVVRASGQLYSGVLQFQASSSATATQGNAVCGNTVVVEGAGEGIYLLYLDAARVADNHVTLEWNAPSSHTCALLNMYECVQMLVTANTFRVDAGFGDNITVRGIQDNDNDAGSRIERNAFPIDTTDLVSATYLYTYGTDIVDHIGDAAPTQYAGAGSTYRRVDGANSNLYVKTADDSGGWQPVFLTPATPPAVTGSRGGNAALASLLTQLAALGLITDSSS